MARGRRLRVSMGRRPRPLRQARRDGRDPRGRRRASMRALFASTSMGNPDPMRSRDNQACVPDQLRARARRRRLCAASAWRAAERAGIAEPVPLTKASTHPVPDRTAQFDRIGQDGDPIVRNTQRLELRTFGLADGQHTSGSLEVSAACRRVEDLLGEKRRSMSGAVPWGETT